MKGDRLEDGAVVESIGLYPILGTVGGTGGDSGWPAWIIFADACIPGNLSLPSIFVPERVEDGAIGFAASSPSGNSMGTVPLPPLASLMGPF